MSLLQKIFTALSAGAPLSASAGETATVRRITAALGQKTPAEARFLAAFAYVLARVANADLDFAASEEAAIRERLSEAHAVEDGEIDLVLQIAREQVEHHSGSENYLVTREFREVSTKAERAKLLEALFAVSAADGEISAAESAEALAIGEELGFTRPETLALRMRWREHLTELKPSKNES